MHPSWIITNLSGPDEEKKQVRYKSKGSGILNSCAQVGMPKRISLIPIEGHKAAKWQLAADQSHEALQKKPQRLQA